MPHFAVFFSLQLPSAPTLCKTIMLPVFECGEGLFECRADVTEEVSETVTNWRRLCRTRIEHVFRRPVENNLYFKSCIVAHTWVSDVKDKRQTGILLAFLWFTAWFITTGSRLVIIFTYWGRNPLDRMWCHSAVPPLSPQWCTGSLPAASCVLEVGSNSWETSPSSNRGPDETNTKWQCVSLKELAQCSSRFQEFTHLRLRAMWQQGHEWSFWGTREKVLRQSSVLIGCICFCVAWRPFQALSIWQAWVCTRNKDIVHYELDDTLLYHFAVVHNMCLPCVCVCVSVSSMLGERPSLSASWGPEVLSSSTTRAIWSLAEREV